MNLRIPESKSGALPLGDTPMFRWGGRWESNPRPSGPQSDALTNCATPAIYELPQKALARLKGFEPLTPALEGRCSIQLSYRRIFCPPSCPSSPLTDFGAGDGNRTHATSLEGWCSTIELHPQSFNA